MAQRVRRLSTGLLCLGGGSLTPAGCCGKSGLGGGGSHSAVAKQGSYYWFEHSAPWPVKQAISIIHNSHYVYCTIIQTILPCCLPPMYGLIFLAIWEGGIGSPQDILTNSTFLPEHSFMLKSYRWWGGGVVVAHKILLSAPAPINPLVL